MAGQLVSKISGLFISKLTGDVDTPEQYFKLTKKCMEQAQKMTSPSLSSSQRINFELCTYLADKLKLAVESAHSFLVLLNKGYIYFPSQKDKENCLNIFKLLYSLAKEVESFIQGCWRDAWIQAAVTLTDVWEHVSSIGFKLELWTLSFLESKKLQDKRRTCLTLTEVDDIFKAEVEIVAKKTLLDRDTLLRNLYTALHIRKSTSMDYQLAVLLLERLERPRLIPNDLPGSSQTLSLSEAVVGSLKQMERLGKGSFATVYKAMWLGVEVAKKTFYGPNFPHFERCQS